MLMPDAAAGYRLNRPFFSSSYQGTDYWDGVGAIIFIPDQNNTVAKIVKAAPPSG